MSKKNLLNEGTIRRFMKLAEIEPLTDQFVGKINEKNGDDPLDPERLKKAADKIGDIKKESMTGEEPVEEGMDVDYMYDEMGLDDGDEETDPEMGDEDDMDLERLFLEMDYQDDDEEVGPDMEAEEEGMEMDAEEGDMEMDAEMDMEEPAAPGGMDPEAMREMVKDAVMDALKQLVDGGDLDISMEEPEEIEVAGEEDEEEMVNEVARRVMKRIINSRR